MRSVSIVGVGRLGGALAIALSRAGVKVDMLVHRGSTQIADVMRAMNSVAVVAFDRLAEIPSDSILITTADQDIRSTAEQIAPFVREGAVVLHTSGSLSSDELSVFSTDRNPVGSLHPLVSVSEPIAGALKFPHAYFCVEGAEPAIAVARSIVESLNGKYISIDTHYKPLYHAAAVTSAGHVVALFDTATEMLARTGVEDPHEVLLPLILSAVESLKTQSTAQALTGSFARGDVAAIERHLAAIDEFGSPIVRQVYLALAERSLELATRSGLDPDRVAKIGEVISIAKRKSGC